MNIKKWILYSVSILFIVFCAYSFRNFEYTKITKNINGIIPFSSNSLVNIYNTDNYLKNKEIKVKNAPSLAALVIAKSAKFLNFNNNPESLQSFISFIIKLFSGITAAVIFIILLNIEISYLLALLTSLLFCVLQASIYGSTGLNFSNEIFAMPVILTAILMLILFLEKTKNIFLFFSGLLIYISLALSQNTQLDLSIISIVLILLYLLKNKMELIPKAILFYFCVSILASLSISYLRHIEYISSPINILIFPICILSTQSAKYSLKKKLLISLPILLVLLLAYFLFFIPGTYINNYQLILKLFLDKIYFLNTKPTNPIDLSFSSRILWNNYLTSPGFKGYWKLFHISFYFSIALLFLVFLFNKTKTVFKKVIFEALFFIFITAIYFIIFIYFVKYSLQASVFLIISIGFLYNIIYNVLSSKYKELIILLPLILLLFIEAIWSLNSLNNNFYYYKTNSELIKLFHKNDFTNKKILCDWSIAPTLKTYNNLIPIFNFFTLTSTNIGLIEKFYKIIYFGSEKDLYNLSNENNIKYLIFSDEMAAGELNLEILYPYSMRYFGNAKNLTKNSIVYKLKTEPLKLKYFFLIDQKLPETIKDKFKIFKFISEEDIKKADEYLSKAQFFFDISKKQEAGNLVQRALELKPTSAEARFLYYQIYNKWPIITLNSIEDKNIR